MTTLRYHHNGCSRRYLAEARGQKAAATAATQALTDYGVRPRETCTLEAQLDAALGRNSKIRDGSAGGKDLASSMTVFDF